MIGVSIVTTGYGVKMKSIISTAKNPRAVMAAAAREGGNQLKKHFRKKDREEPNKLGGKREHFWNKVAQSVSAPVVDDNGLRAVISITDSRFAQKVFGGIIVPKKAKALSIPVIPEAYGRYPAVFEHETGIKLFFLGSEFGNGLLMAQFGQVVKVVYLLRQSVDQDPDPTALPDEKEFETAIVNRAQSVLDRQLNPGGKN